jgi:uncharacterized protein YlxW (UPF0749 family)
MNIKKQILLFFGVMLGILIVAQGKLLFEVKDTLSRDTDKSIFQEIKLLKDKNKDLNKELQSLSENLEKLSNQDLAIEAIKDDIDKFKKISGNYSIFGTGVEVIVISPVHASFIVDLINELNNSGANAIAINGIRISNKTNGIDIMPNGQLFVESFVLSSPYKITAIGDSRSMEELLYANGGLIERTKKNLPDFEIIVQRKEVIQMS